jgi:hypothetical protein
MIAIIVLCLVFFLGLGCAQTEVAYFSPPLPKWPWPEHWYWQQSDLEYYEYQRRQRVRELGWVAMLASAAMLLVILVRRY